MTRLQGCSWCSDWKVYEERRNWRLGKSLDKRTGETFINRFYF